MADGRLAQPDPDPERLLANARKIAKIARTPRDPVNGGFLIERTEQQFTFAIEAFESEQRTREADQARAELEQFQRESDFILHYAPLLLDSSAFRMSFDSLAASNEVGRFFNGIENIDKVVDIARRRMRNPDRLGAAEDATKAATCMLWRAHRKEETIDLYNEFTDVLIKEITMSISKGHLHLVEARAQIARRRLLLTDRKDDARRLVATVSEALRPRTVSNTGL